MLKIAYDPYFSTSEKAREMMMTACVPDDTPIFINQGNARQTSNTEVAPASTRSDGKWAARRRAMHQSSLSRVNLYHMLPVLTREATIKCWYCGWRARFLLCKAADGATAGGNGTVC
jgi:hypothetical protein